VKSDTTKVETVYPKVPNDFHKKRKSFPTLFVDFDVLLYLNGNKLKLNYRRESSFFPNLVVQKVHLRLSPTCNSRLAWGLMITKGNNRVGSGVTPAPSHTTVHAVRHTAVRERLSEDTSPHQLSVLSTALDV